MSTRLTEVDVAPCPATLPPNRAAEAKIIQGLAALAVWALAAPLAAAYVGSEPPQAPTNILMMTADDLGVDIINAYGLGVLTPPTPNIDALAAQGVRFDNAYLNPGGSTSLANIETGRYARRHGIGFTVYSMQVPLSLEEITLPKLLAASTTDVWDTALIGKWFLGNAQTGGLLSPNLHGYGLYEGIPGNLGLDNLHGYSYFNYPLVRNGQVVTYETTYATTRQVDSALEFIGQAAEPWFINLIFNAPHTPIHTPPADLFTVSVPPTLKKGDSAVPFYHAMVEALDTEIGRLLAGIDPEVLARTTVIFLADNGTPQGSISPPFDPSKGKMTPYEGGIKVPLIVTGPHVVSPGRAVEHLVQGTDLFATVAEIAGIDLAAALPSGRVVDSVSLMPYLRDPAALAQRKFAWSELFIPNGIGIPHHVELFAVRDRRHKLIRKRYEQGTAQHEFYDLLADPLETTNLLAGQLSQQQLDAYRKLLRHMTILVDLPPGLR